MGTKTEPSKFDCYANAMEDEPMFILLARDPFAPSLVRAWAHRREAAILSGESPRADIGMVTEALANATEMEQWRIRNFPKWRTKC